MKKIFYVYSPSRKAVIYGDRIGWNDGSGPVLIRDGVHVGEFNDMEEIGESPEDAMNNARKWAEKQIEYAKVQMRLTFYNTNRNVNYYTTLIREMSSMQ